MNETTVSPPSPEAQSLVIQDPGEHTMPAPKVGNRRGFTTGPHGRRNTNRVTLVERNIPQIARLIEAAHGKPSKALKGGRRAAERIAGSKDIEDYLMERIPTQLALLESERCGEGNPKCGQCPIRLLCDRWRRHEGKKDAPKGRKVIDLFCGAGGMSLGFKEAGYVPRLALDADCDAILTYRANRPWMPARRAKSIDIREAIEDGTFRKLRGKVEGVIGGPPCQTFSLVGYRTKRLDNRDHTIDSDQRTWLPVAMAEIIATIKPSFCVMENVGGFMSALNGKIRTETRQVIQDAGYAITEVKVRAERHGAPQNRTRYMLIGIHGAAVGNIRRAQELVNEIHEALEKGRGKTISSGEALAKLDRFGKVLSNGGKEYMLADDGVETWNHYARDHNDRDLGIYELLKPGETASDLEARQPGLIPYELESFHDKYRKLDPKKPSPTIPAHLKRDSNSFILDGVNRGVTPREAAVLQGFPLGYVFLGSQSHQFQQVGNAVPPPVAEAVATLIRKALKLGRSKRWRPSILPEQGPMPSKQVLVLREHFVRLAREGQLPALEVALHWAARRLQTPKVEIAPAVRRELERAAEYRKMPSLAHG